MTTASVSPIVRSIAALTHGRYLLQPAPGGAPRGLLVGFHGYSETALTQLARLAAIPGAQEWTLVSIQGLHRFYRGAEIAASWMTREDRDLAIADNTRYVTGVIGSVVEEYGAGAVVSAGFSQGVSMAFRAACALESPVEALIALGGDVPPELPDGALARIRRAFVARGDRDAWYSEQQFAADQVRLKNAGVDLTTYCFDAEHAWTSEFAEAAGRFLHLMGSSSR